MASISGRPVCSLGFFHSEYYLKRPTREHVDPAPDGSGYLPDRLPLALLLVIFSIAERLTDDEHPVPRDGTMWSAGESYLSAAKHMISALLPIIGSNWVSDAVLGLTSLQPPIPMQRLVHLHAKHIC